MTYWNTASLYLDVPDIHANDILGLLKNMEYWIFDNDGLQISPISKIKIKPVDYLNELHQIVKYMRKLRMNTQSGYSFNYLSDDEEEKYVGGVNTNNNGVVKLCIIDNEGKVTVIEINIEGVWHCMKF